MELKEYQQKTLHQLRKYLEALQECAATAHRLEEAQIFTGYNVFEEAWLKIIGKRNYQLRKNGLNQDIPQICLKIPTGGGKTLLATHAIDHIKTYFVKRPNLLVLWVVPSEAIYKQTLNALRNREHPYRQNLDRTSGGRTLILEKTDRFTQTQIQDQLAILLLMLPSANRRDKETLRMFQDTSGFEDFFPDEDDWQEHKKLITRFPNLDCYGNDNRIGPIKASLGNTLRLLQPLMILDEGHKAYSAISQETIRDFNPCFILELSATPKQESNILYSVSGRDLNREQMIKLDLNIVNMPHVHWKETLTAAIQKLDILQTQASIYRFNGGRYIRPICLIQVERTGKDQQTGRLIHAKDVEADLIQRGIAPNAVAIKSSENDGLENIDLQSEDCPIRFIITKQALQEGWDCPFAYILTMLTNPSSTTGITQLVGRVLRQPYAKKTTVKELDESYVYCFRRKAKELLDVIRRGFDEDGLGDLAHRVYVAENETSLTDVHFRPEFQKFAGKIYLPRFVIEENGRQRLLSYEMDILSRIDWSKVPLQDFEAHFGVFRQQIQTTRVNLSDDGRVSIVDAIGGSSQEVSLTIDPTFVSMQLTDIIPNPWMAFDITTRVIEMMVAQFGHERVAADLVLLITMLKNFLERERDAQASEVFHEMVQQGKLLFVLNMKHGYLLPESIKVHMRRNSQLTRENGTMIQRSLFDAVSEDDLNEEEQDVAVYLDKQEQFILWWDRNFSRLNTSYYLQGWEKGRIYPDFLVSRRDRVNADDYDKIIVLETKGRHLDNEDTKYKKSVFELCNDLVKEWHQWDSALEKDETKQKGVEFLLVFFDEVKDRVNKIVQESH